MLRLMFFLCLTLAASNVLAARTLSGDETWSKKVSVTEVVAVPAGITLTLQPGTELRFTENGSLVIEGRLLARGTAKQPVVLRSSGASATATWPGLTFSNGDRRGSELDHVRITGALTALSAIGSKVVVTASTLEAGGTGIVAGGGAYIAVRNTLLRNLTSGGIDASVQTQGEIVDCRMAQVGDFGIKTAKQATLSIRNNQIKKAKMGIFLNGDSPPVEGNRLDSCEVGIAVIQVSPNTVLRGNTVIASKVGIGCQQFSSPLIEGNIVEDCDRGLDCFQAASPTVRQNRFVRNRHALYCVQMCNPMVEQNDFVDNDTAVYLHLSSYARFRSNNFERNRLHIELDNMSYDWELRATDKPKRQRQAQNEKLAQQGRALATKDIRVDVTSEGFVDARENYWGEATTAEMVKAGRAEVNISTIKDGFDVPTRTYDGWPGEYKQDRVNISGWKKQRIAGTGPTGGQ